MDKIDKLSKLTVALHWIVAIAMIGLMGVGFYMANTETWALYPWHKSIGVLIFIIILMRVMWRIKNGWPQAVRKYPNFEHILAMCVHWTLIIATLAMPITGMIFSGASGHGFGIFGWEIVHGNHSLVQPQEVIPYSEAWANAGAAIHEYLAYLLVAAIALHIVGALKHHLLDRDGTLLRMMGKRV